MTHLRTAKMGFILPTPFTTLQVVIPRYRSGIAISARYTKSSTMAKSALVSPSFLESHPSATILDATWAPPPIETPLVEKYLLSHIPGANFFDLDAPENVSSSPLSHMLPTAEHFKKGAQALGIRKDEPVVVYSRNPFVASARVWWTLRAFGKSDVYVLDGGFDAWMQEGRDIEKGAGGELKWIQ